MSYSPNLGRWLQEDPIEFAAGDNNFYRVEGNNPTNYTDPTGLESAAYVASYTTVRDNSADQDRRRQEAVKKRNKCVADIVDNSIRYTWEEKEQVKRALQPLLDAADFPWSHPCGPFGKCEEWVREYNNRTPDIRNTMPDHFRVTDEVFENKTAPLFKHNVIRITLRGGTEIFLDDGNWGGPGHVVMPWDVGPNQRPIGWPDDWWEPDPLRRRRGYHSTAFQLLLP